jgi:hypothetical protein
MPSSAPLTSKLVFATMIRAADRWCPVSITDLERHQLRLLRASADTAPSLRGTSGQRVHGPGGILLPAPGAWHQDGPGERRREASR